MSKPRLFTLPFCALVLNGCGLFHGPLTIPPGKFVIQDKDGLRYYGVPGFESGKTIVFSTPDGNPKTVFWMYQQNSVIGSINKIKGRRLLHSEIAQFDLNGKLNAMLYEADSLTIIGEPFASWDDSKVLFLTWKMGSPKVGSEGGMLDVRERSLMVLSLDNKQIIETPGLSAEKLMWMSESPWVYGSHQFIYVRVDEVDRKDDPRGFTFAVYLHDVSTKTSRMIIPDGYPASCSPTESKVAYLSKDCAWVYDIETQESRKLMELKGGISDIHWTPDGQRIMLHRSSFLSGDSYQYVDLNGTVSKAKDVPEGFVSWK